MDKRRIRSLGVLLPIVFMLLFLPPYLSIFNQPASIGGVPVLLAYIFIVWIAGIALTAIISRRILRSEHREGED